MSLNMQPNGPPENGNIYHLPEEAMRKEKEWISRAKDDPAEFAPLYHKYHEPVFRFIYRRMDSKDDAFDLSSQVFIKAIGNLKRYEHKDLPFSSWLFRIAINEVNMFYRKSKSERCISLDEDGIKHMGDEMEEDNLAPYHEKMLEKLSELDPEEMAYIQMRFFEKRSFREIADILSITENNAKVKTYRLLDKLKKLILQK